jgi:hypothetical protein
MIKKIKYLWIYFIISVSLLHAQEIKIDPAFWWSGMMETELQLMVHGDDIATYKPEISSENIKIKEVVRLDSPNYQLIYLDISNSKPEQFNIVFRGPENSYTVKYEFKERNPERYDIESFNSSDVLYLIMPDRFANGDPSNDQIEMRMPYKVDRNNPNSRHGGVISDFLSASITSYV